MKLVELSLKFYLRKISLIIILAYDLSFDFFIHEKGESKVIGVVTQDGRKIIAKNVIVNADPFRMRDICYYLFHYKTKNVDKIKIL